MLSLVWLRLTTCRMLLAVAGGIGASVGNTGSINFDRAGSSRTSADPDLAKKSRACQDLIRRMKMQDLVVMCLLLPGTLQSAPTLTCFRGLLLWCSGSGLESVGALECGAEVRVLCHLVLQRVPSAQTGADISPFGPKLPADCLQAANRSRVKFYADPRMYISTAGALAMRQEGKFVSSKVQPRHRSFLVSRC